MTLVRWLAIPLLVVGFAYAVFATAIGLTAGPFIRAWNANWDALFPEAD